MTILIYQKSTMQSYRLQYKKVMATMKRAKKIRIEDKNRQLIKVTPAVIGIIQNLELLTKPKTEPKKRDGSKKNV